MRRLLLTLMLCFGISGFASEFSDEEARLSMTLPANLIKTLDLNHYPSGINFTIFAESDFEQDTKIVLFGKYPIEDPSEESLVDISAALKEKLTEMFEVLGEDEEWKVYSLPSLAKERGARYRLVCKLDEENLKFVGDVHIFTHNHFASLVMCSVITEGCACDLTSYTRSIVETIDFH